MVVCKTKMEKKSYDVEAFRMIQWFLISDCWTLILDLCQTPSLLHSIYTRARHDCRVHEDDEELTSEYDGCELHSDGKSCYYYSCYLLLLLLLLMLLLLVWRLWVVVVMSRACYASIVPNNKRALQTKCASERAIDCPRARKGYCDRIILPD